MGCSAHLPEDFWSNTTERLINMLQIWGSQLGTIQFSKSNEQLFLVHNTHKQAHSTLLPTHTVNIWTFQRISRTGCFSSHRGVTLQGQSFLMIRYTSTSTSDSLIITEWQRGVLPYKRVYKTLDFSGNSMDTYAR